MITIFSNISDSKKIELKELIMDEIKKYKESFEYKDRIKNNYDCKIAKAQIRDICFKRLDINFNQNEKNYMFMYVLTDDDLEFMKICKKNRITEPYKPFKYDFEKIGIYYGITEKIAKLRYRMALENIRIKDKNNTKEEINNEKVLTKRNTDRG